MLYIYEFRRILWFYNAIFQLVRQVMCTVSELDWLSVVRVEKHDEERKTTMIIADNDDVKQPFSQLSRYNVRFQLIDDIGTVSIYYQGS